MSEKESVCEGCDTWERFKHKCHFHWEGKKVCSQFMVPGSLEIKFKKLRSEEEFEKIMQLAEEAFRK